MPISKEPKHTPLIKQQSEFFNKYFTNAESLSPKKKWAKYLSSLRRQAREDFKSRSIEKSGVGYIAKEKSIPYVNVSAHPGVYEEDVFKPSTSPSVFGWGNKQFAQGIPENIPKWVKGDSDIDRLTNWNASVERANLKKEKAFKKKLPVVKLLDSDEKELAMARDTTEYFTSEGMLKWGEQQSIIRKEFYDRIHPKSIHQDILDEIGYVYEKGKFYRSTSVSGDESISVSDMESGKYKRNKGEDPDSWMASEIEGDVGVSQEELSVISSPKRRIKKGSATFSRNEVMEDLMRWERGGHVRYTPGSFSDIITRVSPENFRDAEKNWVVAISNRNVHYMTPEQQFEYGRKVYGQSRYIGTADGKKILAGQLEITGEYFDEIENFKIAALRKKMEKQDVVSAFKEARKIFFRTSEIISEDKRARLEKLLTDSAGQEALQKIKRIKAKNIVRAEAEKLKRDFWDILSPKSFSEISKRGIVAQREYLEGLDLGTKLMLKGGITGEVMAAETAQDIGVATAKGKIVSLASLIEKDKKMGESLMSPVRLVREPGFFPSTYGESSTYYDDFATSVKSLSGEHLGYLERDYAKKINPEISSGLLGEEDIFARIKYDKKRTKYTIDLTRKINGLYVPVDWNVSDKTLSMETLANVYKRKGKMGAVGEEWKTLFAEKFPTKTGQVIGSKETIAGSKIISANEANKPFNRKYAIGAALVAGALLLYGATRKKDQPLTEDGISSGQYGASNMQSSSAQGVYTPQGRIVQNNSGYSTNIDVESSDSNGNVDYRSIVNTMSNISSRALGIQTRSSIHVVDDSQRMDKESMRRSMNNQLG